MVVKLISSKAFGERVRAQNAQITEIIDAQGEPPKKRKKKKAKLAEVAATLDRESDQEVRRLKKQGWKQGDFAAALVKLLGHPLTVDTVRIDKTVRRVTFTKTDLQEMARDACRAAFETSPAALIEVADSYDDDVVIVITEGDELRDSEHACCTCNATTDVTFAPDPYAQDMQGDETPVWMCESCRSQRADET